MKHTGWKQRSEYLRRFADRHGFSLLVTLCVGIITGTALWTNHHASPVPPTPTPPSSGAASASLLMQQSLQQATTPTPLPSPAASPAREWLSPVEEAALLRGYDPDTMQRSGTTGLWGFHDGADLAAEIGTPVCAVSDGCVTGTGQDDLRGWWLTAAFGEDVVIAYEGMSMLAAVQEGDRLHAGQTIGFTGKGPLTEQDMPPHLHLSLSIGGAAADPASLLPIGE